MPKHSKHLLEAKEPRDKQDKIKKVGDSMGRWKEFMESGPDRLPTDESEDYDPDSADEILVAREIIKQEEEQNTGISNKLIMPAAQDHSQAAALINQ